MLRPQVKPGHKTRGSSSGLIFPHLRLNTMRASCMLLLLFMLVGLLSSAHGAVTVGVGKCFTREGIPGFTQRGVCVATTRTYGRPYVGRPIARRGMGVGIRTSVRTLSLTPALGLLLSSSPTEAAD
jgi:hypothetical protein